MGNEGAWKTLIERYQQRIFALVFCLVGRDLDKAYDISAASFVEAIRSASPQENDNIFLTRLASIAIHKCSEVKVIPSFNESEFKNLPLGKQKSLCLVGRALHLLSFEVKTLLLLREQLHLPYKDIAAIYQVSGGEARPQVAKAQMRFREKIEEVLSGGA